MRSEARRRRAAFVALLVAPCLRALAACGLGEELGDRACPSEGTTLDYVTFGRPFLDAHCQGCHGGTGAARRGAPGGFSFATREEVRTHAARIFARAAGANTTMPPGPDDPPAEEREKLAEWLACGAP